MQGWYSIPAHRPFLEDLAAGLIAEYGADPAGLAEAVILLPNRRGARDLAEAFLKAATGRSAVLLPRILALGDLETGEPPFEPADIAVSVAPAVDPLRRRFEMARLAATQAAEEGREIGAAEALATAEALIGFLDAAQAQEKATPGLLDGLELGDQARHFEVSARLLNRALKDWPERLEALGLVDPSERRIIILKRLADQWEANPPAYPVIAAGMTETAPTAARLLAVVAAAPQGCVVLPGLDQGLADEAWREVREAHPQGALKDLLRLGGVQRGEVRVWPASTLADPGGTARQRVINEALRPTEATADWLGVIARLRAGRSADPVAEGLEGLTLVRAAHEEEAATLCALLMRETVETPGRTCALVTPDQGLARRIEARLTRWGLMVDDSAGRPLSRTGPGGLVALAARLMAEPLDPILLLATLKHPDVAAHPKARRGLEDAAFHGPRARSWAEIRERIAAAREPDHRGIQRRPWRRARLERALTLADQLEGLLPEPPHVDCADRWAERLAGLIEGLAGDRAWRGTEGEAAARLVAGLIEHGQALPELDAVAFADLVKTLLDSQTVRTDRATHPRLRVLGAIEARLVRADRMILAGLEEGVWPRAAPADPFLSRPMRRTLGLPSPDARLGLAAHDFAQAASAPEVYLVHADRRDGQPVVPSRWLWRLQTLARGAGVPLADRPELHAWAAALDRSGTYQPAERPAPAPDVAARPTRWSVSDIETLARDPYAIWARKILRLERLAPPDEPIDARLRGTAIHAAFEDFAEALNAGAEADPAVFEARYMAELKAGGMEDAGLARERALARNTAEAVTAFETRRRADGRRVLVEQRAERPFAAGARTHRLSARADRIEVEGGRIYVMDFKTGTPPSPAQVDRGFNPQLTLTGALAMQGGFEDRELVPAGLTYVQVSGRNPPIVEKEAWSDRSGGDPVSASTKAWAGMVARLTHFEDPSEPYASRTAPEFFKDRQGDYAHLARVFEWSSADSDGGDE
ncbi:MAG TPA: double-strand break repair protein AddB [Brevundimonas sp.]|uniref:double-strand break repair protein AddB n=1 Tax=Brevundimonas sp. TaxID=1871086 RepID=UPI002D11D1F9|nr:double-strand break repair protein AddB [Brevundimonas sp.]HRH19913.1 double-strand break repair protein AddB [Brevundimonas sp.]